MDKGIGYKLSEKGSVKLPEKGVKWYAERMSRRKILSQEGQYSPTYPSDSEARAKRSPAAPPAEEVEAWLEQMVHPATMAQLEDYRQRGLRERILTLPVTVALVLSIIRRHIGGISELVRLLGTEELLWVTRTGEGGANKLPRNGYARCLRNSFTTSYWSVLGQMEGRWQERKRPQPPEIAWARPVIQMYWSTTAQPWMRWCARSACCRRQKAIPWPDA